MQIHTSPSATSEILDQLPPCNLDAENQVIGSTLLEPAILDELADVLKPADFYVDANSKIFTVLLSMVAEDVPVGVLTLVDQLKKQGEFETVGGAAYLAELLNSVAVHAHWRHHAKLVRECAQRRNVIHTATTMLRNGYDATLTSEEILATAEAALSNIQTGEYDSAPVTMWDAVVDVMSEIDAIAKRGTGTGCFTGLSSFDEQIGGFFPGELILIASRPSQGKTSLAMQIAAYQASRGKRIYFATLEMSAAELAMKQVCAEAGVSMHRVRACDLREGDHQLLADAGPVVASQVLFLHDRPAIRPSDVLRAARRLKADVIYVDYIQLMTPPDPRKKRHEQIGDISAALKEMSRRLNVPVVACAQFGRQMEQGKVIRPVLSHLRECLATDSTMLLTSSGVQGNMDSLMSLYTWNKQEIVMVDSENVKKHRSPTIVVRLRSGRYLQCTKKHHILTDRGWVEAAKLTIDHAIACAHILEPPDETTTIPHARWMGWMLGNGSMIGYSSPSFSCGDKILAEAFLAATKELFGLTARPHKHWSPNVYQYDITHGYHTSKPNACKTWLMEHGMWGNRAPDKTIPEWFLLQADNSSIAEILGGMVDTDGSIPQFSTGRRSIQYTTTSRTMAYQMLWCLSRLGIYGRIDDGYMSPKSTTPLYKIHIGDGVEAEKFRKAIKLTGRKGRRLLRANFAMVGSNHGNRLGEWVGSELVAHAKRHGLTPTRLGYRDQGKRINRDNLGRLLDVIEGENDKLRWLTDPNIYWDRLRDITPSGVTQVFDRFVPETHNFVANGIIVHNSGSLEQDADVVLGLWRPKGGCDPNSSGHNYDAELAVLKNRKGATATVRLDWFPERTRFACCGEPVFSEEGELDNDTYSWKS